MDDVEGMGLAAYHEIKSKLLHKFGEAGAEGLLQAELGQCLVELGLKRDKSVKLVKWVADYLSIPLYTDSANLRVALHPLEEMTADRQIMDLVYANLDEDGTMKLARLGNLMAENGFGRWRDNLAPGETSGKLYEWAQRHLGTDFSVKCMEDGLTWYLERRTGQLLNGKLYPEEIDCADAASQDEVARMHAFADMGPEEFTALRDELCRMSGYEGNDPEVWKACVARCVAYAQAHPDEQYRGVDPQTEREFLAIRLKGLTTPKGHQLYLLLQENEGGQPRWRADSVGYASDVGRGKWIQTVLGIPVDNVTEERQRAALSQVLVKLDALCQDNELPALLEHAADCIRNGRAFVSRDGVEKLSRYLSLWQEAESYDGFLGLKLANGAGTVEQLRAALTTQDPLFARLQACGNRFAQLIGVLREQLSLSFRPGSESDQVLCRDMEQAEQLTRLCAAQEQERTAALELLRLYGGLCELSRMDCVEEDRHSNLLQAAADHLALSYLKLSRSVLGNEEIQTLVSEQADVEAELLACLQELEQRAAEEAQEEQQERAALIPDGRSRVDVVREMLDPTLRDSERFQRVSAVFGQENEFEEAIVDGDLELAKRLAGDGSPLVENYGYSPERAAQICAELQKWDKLPSGMTPVYVGNRLTLIQKNEHGQAERYWLMDVLRSPAAARNLMELYRESNRSEEFLILFGQAEGGLEDRRYALKCRYAAEDHAGVLQVVRRNPEIIYQLLCRDGEDVLEQVQDAANQWGDAELKEYCAAARDRVRVPAADCLDQMIIRCSWEQLDQMLREPEKMAEELGRSQKELLRLRTARTSEELPDGTTDSAAALRLWKLQQNRGGLAEYYAWRGLTADNMAEQMDQVLFPLLGQAERWAEVSVLYQAYQARMERSRVCSRVYLRALCARTPQKVGDFVRDHMSDGLHSDCYRQVQPICREQAPGLGRLLERLHQAAEDPFCKAVISCDMLTLKPYSWQPERLVSQGFSEEDAQRISGLIRSGKYPKGQQVGQLAWRLFLFFGAQGGLAEEVTNLAIADAEEQGIPLAEGLSQSRIQLLWMGRDWSALDRVFREQPELAEGHLQIYGETLFQVCAYEAYMEKREQLAGLLPREAEAAFAAIARVRTEEPEDPVCCACLELPRDYVRSRAEELGELSRWLWESGRRLTWMGRVPQWFWEGLPFYSTQQLCALLGAGGLVEQEELETVLAAWTETEAGTAAAVYAWKHLGAKLEPELVQRYYDRALEKAWNAEGPEREDILVRLTALFPERAETMRTRSAFKILEEAGEHALSAQQMERLQEQLTGEDIDQAQKEWIAVKLISFEEAAKQLLSALVPLWTELLRDGRLAEADIDRICGLCEACGWQAEAVELLARIYGQSGEPARAAAAQVWGTAAQCGWEGVSLLAVLQTLPREMDQLQAFMDTLAKLAPPEREALALAEEWSKKEGLCTEAEAEQLLRVCGHEEAKQYLTSSLRCLPLADCADLRLELLLLCAANSGLRVDWRYCINYAVISGQERELPRLFLKWLEQTQESADAAAILEQMTSTLQLESDDMEAAEASAEERAVCERLLDRLCRLGQLLNAQQKEHWLRVLADFGARYALEERLLETAGIMEEYYREAGLPALSRLVCRMLLVGHIAAAERFLHEIAARPEVKLLPATLRVGSANYGHRYHEDFFLPMAEMAREELAALAEQRPVRIILQCLLFDGKLPSYDNVLKKQVWPAITRNDPEELWDVARALRRMWQLVPMDYALARALFFVCKQLYACEVEQGVRNGSAELLALLYEAELGICQELCRRPDAHVFSPRVQRGGSPSAQLCDLILLGCLLERRNDINTDSWDEGRRPSLSLFRTVHRDMCAMEARKREKQESRESRERSYRMMPFPEHSNYYTDCRGRLAELDREALQRTEILILCRVTGVWKAGIRQLFEAQELIQDSAAHWLRDPRIETLAPYSHETGILRGVLQVYLELGDEELQTQYRDWVGRNDTTVGSRTTRKECFKPAAVLLRSHGELVSAERDLLALPLEETALDVDLMESALRANSSVSGEEEWHGRDYKRLEQRAMLMAFLQGETRYLVMLGLRYFRTGEAYRRSGEERRDLNASYAYCRAAQTASRYVQNWQPNENYGRYLACHILARIKAFFSVYEATVFNAFTQTLCYGTAEDAARFLANMELEWEGKTRMEWEEQRKELLYLYPVIIGETVIGTEEEIRQFLECTPEGGPVNESRLRVRMALLREKGVEAAYLKRRLAEAEAKRPLREVVFSASLDDLSEKGFPTTAELKVWAEELRQNMAAELERAAKADAETGVNKPLRTEEPAYISRISHELDVRQAPEDGAEELRRKIAGLQRGDELGERRRLCCLLYHKVKQEAPELAAVTRLRLGIEEWRWQQRLQNSDLANQTLLEMLEDFLRCSNKQKHSPIGEAFVKLAPIALFELFSTSCTSLRELADLYFKNQDGLELLLDHLDERNKPRLQRICAGLDLAAVAFNNQVEREILQTVRGVRKDFLMAERDCENDASEWGGLFSRMRALADGTIDQMIAGPSLEIQVLNRKDDPSCSIFGLLHNKGNRDAEQIALKVRFRQPGVVTRSDTYTLKRLGPGRTAAFRIRFDVPAGTTLVGYELTARCSWEEGTFYAHPKEGEQAVSDSIRKVNPQWVAKDIEVGDFTLNAQGEVYSPDMVGRKDEIQRLRGCFSGPFASFRNTVVYGFRRVGKTTLLNYLYSHVKHEGEQDGVMPLYVSCQAAENLQDALIKGTLTAMLGELGQNEALRAVLAGKAEDGRWETAWGAFQEEKPWLQSEKEAGEDVSAYEIVEFFTRLSILLERKFVLLLDEFDCLFREDIDFSTLDALVSNNMALNRAARFVFCGSNYMIAYMMNGGALTQFFQRLEKVGVGSVRREALYEYLQKKPISGDALRFTPGALDCIYRFTNGFIWFSGLMAKGIADRLARENRLEVYPCDVYAPGLINSIISEDNCKQFKEGCNAELLKLLADQCPHQDSCVPRQTIQEHMPEVHSADLQLLCKMGLIEAEESGCYRFANELYRCYFRSGRHTEGDEKGRLLVPEEKAGADGHRQPGRRRRDALGQMEI